MKILVVGAGIGGMAATAFLEKKGFNVTLIERAPEFKHIGFGMTLFSNSRKLLEKLEIEKEVSKEGFDVPWLEMTDTRGKMIGEKVNLTDLKKFGYATVIIERAALHENLSKKINPEKLRLGTMPVKIINGKDRVDVEFSDGKRESFDLIVAADGIHSGIREQFFGKGHNKYYGWSLRFFWMPEHIPVPKGTISLSKEKMTFAIYPLSEKRGFVGIYEYNPERKDKPPIHIEDFLPYLEKHGWKKEHISAIEKEAAEGHQYYDHLQHIRLSPWYKNRIVLLGDSKHGMSPLTGMGAGMAIEDAFTLADELSKNKISVALKNYAKRRNKHVKNALLLSAIVEKYYFIKSKGGIFLRSMAVKVFKQSPVLGRLQRLLSEPL